MTESVLQVLSVKIIIGKSERKSNVWWGCGGKRSYRTSTCVQLRRVKYEKTDIVQVFMNRNIRSQ